MHLSPLTAISPIDGRYHSKTNSLSGYFSEWALIRYRLNVEIRYFLFLSKNGFFKLSKENYKRIEALEKKFSTDDALKIKATEQITNHDVKAVEYFLKDQLKAFGLEEISEWVHFGLTSQDVNNTANPMLWRDALNEQYIPRIKDLVTKLKGLSSEWKQVSMLARTHGQPASPTRMGKEIKVFEERISIQLELLQKTPHTGKFGGATGNFNAHHVAFPKVNWRKLGDQFLKEELGLQRQQFTTQIEHYDMLAAHFDALARINTILIDFCRDIWTYISMDYFKQQIRKDEVGSSAMPHKVNPIDFENAEGNLGMANALFVHLSAKLPVSRLQRDLTDSTVLRNIGVPLSHTIIALQSIEKGIAKLILNKEKIAADLDSNWAVIAEAIQTILRREGYPNPYEALKQLTRKNAKMSKETIHSFIDTLNVSKKIKAELKRLSPQTYVGHNF